MVERVGSAHDDTNSGPTMRSGRHAPATRVVHAGLPEPTQGAPMLPGPTFAGPYHLRGEPDSTPYGYARYANPTWSALESALGELEGGPALTFASGMAAASAVLLPSLSRGDVLVLPEECYGGIKALVRDRLEPEGVVVRRAGAGTAGLIEAAPGARAVWVETPTNPELDVVDIAAVAVAARDAGAELIVDGTLATPLLQRALALGADVVVCSGSKHLSGHSDVILGYVAVREAERLDPVRAWRSSVGAVPGPFEAWLTHRSLATLDVRLERQCANALALAELLATRDDVTDVRYPGLPSHPEHGLATVQMAGRFGGVLGFDVGTASRAQAFLEALTLVAEATSFGGVHSMAERRARWGIEDVAEGFIRFSAGVEDAGDLRADVAAALDATRPVG
ncbi:MAG: cystathionine gamma-lyase [Solirubrobacteraceae bacterium]|nr:cystathionine gamma-lyase [Solirubrobacteraceae bacterium]